MRCDPYRVNEWSSIRGSHLILFFRASREQLPSFACPAGEGQLFIRSTDHQGPIRQFWNSASCQHIFFHKSILFTRAGIWTAPFRYEQKAAVGNDYSQNMVLAPVRFYSYPACSFRCFIALSLTNDECRQWDISCLRNMETALWINVRLRRCIG
jgi:hypothetical protein